jgi:sugar lactone lactonase YvrE
MVGVLAWASPALAVPDCAQLPVQKTLLEGQGVLESVLVDSSGRLLWTDTSKNALMAIDAPGATPRVVAEGIAKPGGLLEDRDGSIVVGSGDGFQEGAIGNVMGQAKLIRVDPVSGRQEVMAEGLSMANGLAWGPDHEIYASDDAGTGIDKVVGAEVQPRWASVISSNGLAVGGDGKNLFAAQTFQPPAIQRIPLADPAAMTTYATGAPDDLVAGLDGMTIDHLDRLFVAANGGGQVWRVDTDGSVCALARGFLLSSAVALGKTSLFVVTFSGVLAELENVRPAPPEPEVPASARTAKGSGLSATVAPRRIRAGKRISVRLQLRPAIAGATLRLAGRSVRTDARGRATLRLRVKRPGRYAVTHLGRRVATLRVR